MKTKDMTTGNVFKVLLTFALPMILSVSFQQLYNIADSVIAGRFIGKDALAAVSASYPITMIYLAIGTGSGIGCSVVASQIFGTKDFKQLKTCISTSLISIFTIGVISLILGVIINEWCMRALNTPENVFKDAEIYLRINVYGLVFLFVYNACNAIFQALGNSKTPLYFLIFSTIFNVFLNLLFVIKFNMGVAGLAWATFIAQGIACILSLFILLKNIKNIPSEKYELFSGTLFRYILLYAIPSIIQASIVSVGQLFIQGIVNSFGSDVTAGFGAAFKINLFVVSIANTMSNAVSNFTAQNIGAKEYDRIKKGFKHGLLIACIFLLIPFVFIFFKSSQLIGLFLDSTNTEQVIEVGKTFLIVVSPFYFVLAIKVITDGILKGAGELRVFMISTFTDLIIRVLLSFILTNILNSPSGIWYSYPIGWIIGAIVSVVFYYQGNWKNNKLEFKNG